ncbi:MAG: lytic transglycosylase domain-containing protein [Thermotogae bacterium]|nr:lytic transglycosylase domain-containing protein [Thermotogota bacterium]
MFSFEFLILEQRLIDTQNIFKYYQSYPTKPATRIVYYTTTYNPTPTFYTKSYIMDLIVLLSNKYNVDSGLVKAMVEVESSFSPFSISSKGALGLMQLMPDACKDWVKGKDYLDPVANLGGGIRYLKNLLKEFHGDVKLALMAYNAGMSAVKNKKISPEVVKYADAILNVWKNKYGGK